MRGVYDRTPEIKERNRLGQTSELREIARKRMLGVNNPNFGRQYTQEERENQGQKLRGRKRTDEQKKKMSLISKVVQNRPEVKRATTAAKIRLWADPMKRELRIKSLQEAHHTDSYREHCRQAKLGPLNHWYRGGSNEPYGIEFNEFLKAQIRDRDDHLCQMPGCYLPENGKKHDVHHIDYTKSHNKQKNLISLCHKHHIKTNSGDRDRWTVLFQELQTIRRIEMEN